MKNISIAIPTYNSAIYLEALLNKVIKFEVVNEILICDDGSELSDLEKLVKLCEKFKRYKKIKLLKNNKNIGAFNNKLKVIDACSNRFVYQIDSDNLPGKKIEKVLEKIISNPTNDKIIYYPHKLNQFRKNYLASHLNNKNNVVFSDKNLLLNLEEIKKCLVGIKNPFIDKHIMWVLNSGNFVVDKNLFNEAMKPSQELKEPLSSDAVAISYYWLKYGGQINLTQDLWHYHRKRWDSVSFSEGEMSHISANYFKQKILELK